MPDGRTCPFARLCPTPHPAARLCPLPHPAAIATGNACGRGLGRRRQAVFAAPQPAAWGFCRHHQAGGAASAAPAGAPPLSDSSTLCPQRWCSAADDDLFDAGSVGGSDTSESDTDDAGLDWDSDDDSSAKETADDYPQLTEVLETEVPTMANRGDSAKAMVAKETAKWDESVSTFPGRGRAEMY